MVQQYYNLEKAAEVLGVYPAELNEMREKGKLRAFRDGGNWKFKKEEVDDLAVELRSKKAAGPKKPGEKGGDEDSQDVLLSEVELGGSNPSASGTVIGTEGYGAGDSDIKLAGSDVGLAAPGREEKGERKGIGDETTAFEELDLAIEDDIRLEDSQPPLADVETGEKVVKTGSADSAIELGEAADEDLVLGGSGSDITIGQDSGISLVDPHDSGLSLDEPLELASDDESLALGEDDMLTLGEEAEAEAPTELKGDDFLLTPLEEAADEEDTESGSQVIALDEAAGDEAATLVAPGPAGGMAAMLDEDAMGAEPGLAGPSFEPVAAPGGFAPAGAPQPVPGGAPLAPAAAALPEQPYGTFAMVGLSLCTVMLVLSGMMAYDLMRNMWSWRGPYDVTSSLMNLVVKMFGG